MRKDERVADRSGDGQASSLVSTGMKGKQVVRLTGSEWQLDRYTHTYKQGHRHGTVSHAPTGRAAGHFPQTDASGQRYKQRPVIEIQCVMDKEPVHGVQNTDVLGAADIRKWGLLSWTEDHLFHSTVVFQKSPRTKAGTFPSAHKLSAQKWNGFLEAHSSVKGVYFGWKSSYYNGIFTQEFEYQVIFDLTLKLNKGPVGSILWEQPSSALQCWLLPGSQAFQVNILILKSKWY